MPVSVDRSRSSIVIDVPELAFAGRQAQQETTARPAIALAGAIEAFTVERLTQPR